MTDQYLVFTFMNVHIYYFCSCLVFTGLRTLVSFIEQQINAVFVLHWKEKYNVDSFLVTQKVTRTYIMKRRFSLRIVRHVD